MRRGLRRGSCEARGPRRQVHCTSRRDRPGRMSLESSRTLRAGGMHLRASSIEPVDDSGTASSGRDVEREAWAITPPLFTGSDSKTRAPAKRYWKSLMTSAGYTKAMLESQSSSHTSAPHTTMSRPPPPYKPSTIPGPVSTWCGSDAKLWIHTTSASAVVLVIKGH